MILQNGKRIDGCSDTVPIGTLQPFLGLIPPKGYLVCQGQTVSKITYRELYEICGDAFGTSTETEFYLPDLRGKTIAGYDESDEAMNAIGKLLGQKSHTHTTGNHTLTIAEMPSHTHDFASSSEGSDHLASRTMGYLLTEGDAYPGYAGISVSGNWGSYGTLRIEKTGGGQAHNHGNTGESLSYQPTIFLNWIVKAVMTIPVQSSLATSYTDSSTDVYTCDYVNEVIRTGIGDNVPAGTIVDYDGDIIPEGWEAAFDDATVYVGSTQPTDGQDIWIQKSKNLVKGFKHNWGYNGSTNQFEDNPYGFTTTDFIDVQYGTTYMFSHDIGQPQGGVYMFDEKGTYLGLLNADDMWRPITITDPNCTQIVIYTWDVNNQTTTNETWMQLEVGDVVTDYMPYDGYKIYTKNKLGTYDKIYDSTETDQYTYAERRIGTWVNGEPLYRKVIKVVPAAQHYTDYPHGIERGPKDMIKFYGYYRRTSSQYMNPLPCTYPAWEAYLYDLKGATYSMRFSDNVWNSGIDYCYVVIEYTKK